MMDNESKAGASPPTYPHCPSCNAIELPGLNPHFSWCLYANSGAAFLSSIPDEWPMERPPPYPADDEDKLSDAAVQAIRNHADRNTVDP